MKKMILILCVLAFATASFGAPAFGVKGGLNLANASQDPSEGFDTKIKMGLLLGGTMEFSLSQSNKTMLRLEGLYVQKGWKEEGDMYIPGWGTVSYEGTASIDELVLAPFLVLRFPSEGMTPFLQFGPELGFNLSAKAKAEAEGESETDDIEDWSSTNFGINIGGGIAVPSGKGEVIFDARYNLGLMNMYTGNDDYTVKTNGIQFLVGYNFSVPTK
jgi:hypothetical protein